MHIVWLMPELQNQTLQRWSPGNSRTHFPRTASERILSLTFPLLLSIFPEPYTHALASSAYLCCSSSFQPKAPPKLVFYSSSICFRFTFNSSDLIQLKIPFFYTRLVGEKQLDINFIMISTLDLDFKEWSLI